MNKQPPGDRDGVELDEIVRRIVRVAAGFIAIEDAGR
jgi:hypothetical protein